MKYTVEFNDLELADLEAILIQPKVSGYGYTIHRIEKSKPDDGWDEWRKKIEKTFDIAQEKKTVTEEFQSRLKKHHAAIVSKSKRLDKFKSYNNFDIWETRFSDHKTLNKIFRAYFPVDNNSECEFTELIHGIESAFNKFNRVHELSMYEFFVYIGYYQFLNGLDALHVKALVNTKWTESNPFDCNLNIVPPCGEDDNTVSYYIVFSTAPKYIGD